MGTTSDGGGDGGRSRVGHEHVQAVDALCRRFGADVVETVVHESGGRDRYPEELAVPRERHDDGFRHPRDILLGRNVG